MRPMTFEEHLQAVHKAATPGGGTEGSYFRSLYRLINFYDARSTFSPEELRRIADEMEAAPTERYVAGRWDDNSFNVYDREQGNKAIAAWGYMSLNEAQEAARTLNEKADGA